MFRLARELCRSLKRRLSRRSEGRSDRHSEGFVIPDEMLQPQPPTFGVSREHDEPQPRLPSVGFPSVGISIGYDESQPDPLAVDIPAGDDGLIVLVAVTAISYRGGWTVAVETDCWERNDQF